MLRLLGSLSLIWVVMAISTMAQNPPVLDNNGQPLRSGVEYYILPAITDVAGGLILVDRNGSCPFYVGQVPLAPIVSQGLPVIFTPFAAGETIIRESRDLKIAFSTASTCVESTSWKVGETNPESFRRYIEIGEAIQYNEYFRISRNESNDPYNLVFCPLEACPTCRFRCGNAGILIENDKRLLALDGPAFPFVFKRA